MDDKKLEHLFKLHFEGVARTVVKKQAPAQLMEELLHLRMSVNRINRQLEALREALNEYS